MDPLVKIITGYSEKGGSTSALIKLTNELNSNNIPTVMYGPHEFHLNKCRSKLMRDLKVYEDDTLITHFLQLPRRPAVKRIVLSCHEKWWFKVGNIKQHWDKVIFLHKEHQKYHKEYKGEFEIIPNLKPALLKKEKPELDLIAGIIGSIEDRKQTHISIERALKDNCVQVKLFGAISDQNYFNQYVKPLLSDKVIHVGFSESLQSMYDSIGRVYHSSKGEVACLVKDECYLTNTKFFGGIETENEVSTLSNEQIINKWKQVLEL